MFTRVMRRPPGTRRRPTELSKEAEAIAAASISVKAQVCAGKVASFETCQGCVAKKMCRQSNICMYGSKSRRKKANAKNG